MTGKFVSYLRVSTQRQGKSGLGLDAQREAVNGFLNGGRWKLVAEVIEVESGKRSDRPELAKALSLCRLHGATLLVAKLDRLARDVAFISTLMKSSTKFVAVDLPQANELTIHVLAAMAEYETRAVSTRTKAALAAAKRRGVVLGGRRVSAREWSRIADRGRKLGTAVGSQRAAKWAHEYQPVIDDLRQSGAVTLQQIADGLNERGIQTPRNARLNEREIQTRNGGTWTPTQVLRIQRILAA
jgi:DNA invertase Pin-like site-specific DNA recombinase